MVKARGAAALARAALVSLLAAGCGDEQPEQSFAEAMKIVCGSGSGELARLPGRVSNREARYLLAAAASQPGHRLPAVIDRAARKAGLEQCRILEATGPALPFDPPSAAGQLVDIGGVVGPLLVIGTDAIYLDEREIVKLVSGKVPDSAMRDGPLGLTIQALVRALEEWELPRQRRSERWTHSSSGGGVGVFATLLVAPSAPYRVVFEAIASAREVGLTRFVILVALRDGTLGGIELGLPLHVAPADLRDTVGSPPVQLIVSLADRKLVLWSLSGLEGTLAAPRLELTARPDDAGGHPFDTAHLTAALVAVADARWPGGEPPPEQREIIVQAADDTPFQTIVDVMVAARRRADGRDLFPAVLFGRSSFD